MVVEDRRLGIQRHDPGRKNTVVAGGDPLQQLALVAGQQTARLLDHPLFEGAVGSGAHQALGIDQRFHLGQRRAGLGDARRLVGVTGRDGGQLQLSERHPGVRGGRVAAVDQNRSGRQGDAKIRPRFAGQQVLLQQSPKVDDEIVAVPQCNDAGPLQTVRGLFVGIQHFRRLQDRCCLIVVTERLAITRSLEDGLCARRGWPQAVDLARPELIRWNLDLLVGPLRNEVDLNAVRVGENPLHVRIIDQFFFFGSAVTGDTCCAATREAAIAGAFGEHDHQDGRDQRHDDADDADVEQSLRLFHRCPFTTVPAAGSCSAP